MKALVLGSGIVGITTAYELNRNGYDVTVIDREAEPASFTSYGNAGMIAPGHAYAWSSPAAPGILMKSLWRNDQALRFKFSADPRFWKWMWKFWGQCTPERAATNTKRKLRLSLYSQGVFHETVAATGIQYDSNQGGLLYLYRTPSSFRAAATKSKILSDNGASIQTLDPDQAARIDPALENVKNQFAGALYVSSDETGDCRLFARNMRHYLEPKGVTFKFNTTITGFDIEGDTVKAVITDKGRESADIYIMSLGVYSPHLSEPLGVDLPIYPVKGYSVTFPVAGRNNPPKIGGVDEENLVAYTPMGDRLRVTSTAEFSGYSNSHTPSDFRNMLKVIKGLFPDGADYAQGEYWAGLRPMTPEGTPIIGRGKQRNLYFNTGQGHMGWTMSHAGARIVTDIIQGKTPAIPMDGMTVPA